MDPNKSQSSVSRTSIGKRSLSAIGRAGTRFSRTFGTSSAVKATGKFLRRQLWAWPIIAAMILGGVGWWVYSAVESAMRQQRVEELTTILDADVAALRVWMADQENNAEMIAEDERLRPLVEELLPLSDGKPGVERRLLQAKSSEAIRARLAPKLARHQYAGFFVVSPEGKVLASDQDTAVGRGLGAYRQEFFTKVLAGGPSVSRPYRSPLLLADENGDLKAHLPTMFTAAAIRDEAGKPIAALGLRIRPDDQFTRILQTARAGQTGETYAFDRNGLMLTQSRFDEDLKEIGLLADLPDSRSVLTIELRDPQANMIAGERPKGRRATQPLTRLAALAVGGETGHDVDGYRDYRGVPSVGAWTWLPEYDFGVATEMEKAESFRPVYILRTVFWVVMALLLLSAVGIFFAMLYMARQQAALQKAVLAAGKLGQYTLEEKLGAGSMGTVYRARHAMLRRPTAIKLLNVEAISEATIARFEREVQLTSGLTHPNTVAIYDFGRTPEGIFYYAMEYLEGTNLDNLVSRVGPLPEARVVYILRQICGSLAEAHAGGLVHRDIKPANIFLTCRGGMHDFVKVLDFGLVKTLGSEDAHLTNANAVTGTPLYLSPEAVNQPDHVDPRSDVYAIGAVGYFLLTGSPVFLGDTVMEICMKHVQETPQLPSERRGQAMSPELEELILRCLAKSQSDRPTDAAAVQRELATCDVPGAWSADAAATWWAANRTRVTGPTPIESKKPPAPAPAAPTDAGATTGYQGPAGTLLGPVNT
jgi:hypothetical protein